MPSNKGGMMEIARIALFARLLYLSTAYLGYALIPRFDKSTELHPSTSAFNFLLSWDAVHFHEVMTVGYKKTHLLAFFPLLPLISRCLQSVLPLDSFTIGVLFTNLTTLLCSLVLYKITLLKHSQKTARLTAILFSFNPASIVYTSMYSESLFMLLFLLGLFHAEVERKIRATVYFSLCCLCRSNGILFIVWLVALFRRNFVFAAPLFLLPFAAFQYYGLLQMNRVYERIGVFIPYSYIQRKYWDQGLFKFITLKNSPNILVGLPFLLLSCYIMLYNMKVLFSPMKPQTRSLEFFRERMLTSDFVCVVLLLLQTVITVLIIHWNMYFRFISYNPIIYWSLAVLYQRSEDSLFRDFLFKFYFGFGIVYAFLFGCFYPPC
jgi:GPI mannosyltransferase 2